MFHKGAKPKNNSYKSNNHETKVQEDLINMFGHVMDPKIIKSIALNCSYNPEVATNILLDLSKGQENLPDTRFSCNSPATRRNEKNQISNKEKNVFRVISSIHQGHKILILMRGLPGSGKSHLAREIVEKGTKSNNYMNYIFSADDFFLTRNGNYNFNPQKIGDAHAWNQHRVWLQIMKGFSPIIIDNTNTCMWEMKNYATMAVPMGYIIEIIEPFTCWAFNVKELHIKNIHNVPKDKIRDMLERYEKNVTPQKLLSAFNLQYKVAPSANSWNGIANNTNETEIEEATLPPKNEENLLEVYSSHEEKETTIPIVDFENLTVEDNSLYPDLSAWGVNDNILNSWDIVTPVAESVKQSEIAALVDQKPEEEINKNDADTNTYQEDFAIIHNADFNENIKYIKARGRDINVNTSIKETRPMKKSVLDKSSMTIEENLLPPKSDADNVQELSQLFPNIPEESIRDMYERCDKDIHWVVELLLETNIMVLPDSLREQNAPKETNLIDTENPSNETNLIEIEEVPEETDNIIHKPLPEELKRLIEEKVKINPIYYSKNVLKIKQQKEKVASESSEYDLMIFDEAPYNSPKKQTKNEKIASYETTAGAVLAGDSDIDFSDFSDSELSSGSNEDRFVELNLGNEAVQQLETKFGDPNLTYPKGFLPIVQVPVALARQLHAVYLESVYQQLDVQNEVLQMLIKEDEVFAKQLHDQEVETMRQQQPPDLKEIMEEEAALNVYKKEIEEWRKLTPDDLASRLTRQKLINSFPLINEEVLVEILHAHNNCYVDTVDSLIASLPNFVVNPNGNLKEPPISSSTLEHMKIACNETTEVNEENCNAEYYRTVAAKHFQKHQELLGKAQQHFRSGSNEVAVFYLDLAKTQTHLLDKANSMAAAALLENSNRLGPDTLDLHHLYVKEAINALNIFLDQQIVRLGESNKSMNKLLIITGRGNNSVNGIPRVRPAVIAQLRKRKISFAPVNPGLLQIKIYKSTMVVS